MTRKPCILSECAKEQNLSVATCLLASLQFVKELFGAVSSSNLLLLSVKELNINLLPGMGNQLEPCCGEWDKVESWSSEYSLSLSEEKWSEGCSCAEGN